MFVLRNYDVDQLGGLEHSLRRPTAMLDNLVYICSLWLESSSNHALKAMQKCFNSTETSPLHTGINVYAYIFVCRSVNFLRFHIFCSTVSICAVTSLNLHRSISCSQQPHPED